MKKQKNRAKDLALKIKRSMRQVESALNMSVDEAIAALRTL